MEIVQDLVVGTVGGLALRGIKHFVLGKAEDKVSKQLQALQEHSKQQDRTIQALQGTLQELVGAKRPRADIDEHLQHILLRPASPKRRRTEFKQGVSEPSTPSNVNDTDKERSEAETSSSSSSSSSEATSETSDTETSSSSESESEATSPSEQESSVSESDSEDSEADEDPSENEAVPPTAEPSSSLAVSTDSAEEDLPLAQRARLPTGRNITHTIGFKPWKAGPIKPSPVKPVRQAPVTIGYSSEEEEQARPILVDDGSDAELLGTEAKKGGVIVSEANEEEEEEVEAEDEPVASPHEANIAAGFRMTTSKPKVYYKPKGLIAKIQLAVNRIASGEQVSGEVPAPVDTDLGDDVAILGEKGGSAEKPEVVGVNQDRAEKAFQSRFSKMLEHHKSKESALQPTELQSRAEAGAKQVVDFARLSSNTSLSDSPTIPDTCTGGEWMKGWQMDRRVSSSMRIIPFERNRTADFERRSAQGRGSRSITPSPRGRSPTIRRGLNSASLKTSSPRLLSSAPSSNPSHSEPYSLDSHGRPIPAGAYSLDSRGRPLYPSFFKTLSSGSQSPRSRSHSRSRSPAAAGQTGPSRTPSGASPRPSNSSSRAHSVDCRPHCVFSPEYTPEYQEHPGCESSSPPYDPTSPRYFPLNSAYPSPSPVWSPAHVLNGPVYSPTSIGLQNSLAAADKSINTGKEDAAATTGAQDLATAHKGDLWGEFVDNELLEPMKWNGSGSRQKRIGGLWKSLAGGENSLRLESGVEEEELDGGSPMPASDPRQLSPTPSDLVPDDVEPAASNMARGTEEAEDPEEVVLVSDEYRLSPNLVIIQPQPAQNTFQEWCFKETEHPAWLKSDEEEEELREAGDETWKVMRPESDDADSQSESEELEEIALDELQQLLLEGAIWSSDEPQKFLKDRYGIDLGEDEFKFTTATEDQLGTLLVPQEVFQADSESDETDEDGAWDDEEGMADVPVTGLSVEAVQIVGEDSQAADLYKDEDMDQEDPDEYKEEEDEEEECDEGNEELQVARNIEGPAFGPAEHARQVEALRLFEMARAQAEMVAKPKKPTFGQKLKQILFGRPKPNNEESAIDNGSKEKSVEHASQPVEVALDEPAIEDIIMQDVDGLWGPSQLTESLDLDTRSNALSQEGVGALQKGTGIFENYQDSLGDDEPEAGPSGRQIPVAHVPQPYAPVIDLTDDEVICVN